jgi:vacuolar-type H+-ATPase subunit H
VFPNITVDELIQKARQERSSIIKYCKNREIEIIPDESQYIKWLHKKNFKIIGE